MSTQQFLGDEESLADLESRIDPSDSLEYASHKHLRVEAAFYGRLFVLYRPTGLTKEGRHRPPEVLAQVRVINFTASSQRGCQVEFENMATGQVQTIGHVPERLFNYSVFISAAPFMRLRWDGRRFKGVVKRSLCFGLLIKQRTRADHYSAGAEMLETPGSFRSLYPSYDLQLQYS